MPQTNLLRRYGLSRNPFTDRTAEKTALDEISLYLHSDLHNFQPSDETYLFFGKRGSGKTTIRLSMQRAYDRVNEELAKNSKPEHFIVDLCRPGHMTSCLKDFQEIMNCSTDNWDAVFVDNWACADLVDCIFSYAVTSIVEQLTAEDSEGRKRAVKLQTRMRASSRLATRFIILAQLYARCDEHTLRRLRNVLQPWLWPAYAMPSTLSLPMALAITATITAIPVTLAAAGTLMAPGSEASAGAAGARRSSRVEASGYGGGGEGGLWARTQGVVASVAAKPTVAAAGVGIVTVAGLSGWARARHRWGRTRATQLQGNIRVVKRRPVERVADVLNVLVSSGDSADTIRQIHVGVSAHQKLEKLVEIIHLLGYQDLCVFGDCFDEVTLLDPVLYPRAIKQFAKEVCRNDLLNFGRMHFFFPDSRMNLDLTTDQMLKEARFDRHFVRDMHWSRHQLEELAERRFQAAQAKYGVVETESTDVKPGTPFSALFKEVNGEDFAAYVGQLETPRELLIMMTEMFTRIEQNPSGKLKAQDMEFAVKQAKQMSV